MARTIAEIKKQMTDNFTTNETIIAAYQLQEGKTFDEEFSSVSVENIIFYITAFFAWSIENLHDLFKQEVNEILATKKPHTLRWYAEKVKQFQLGFDLVQDADYYDNIGVSAEDITASKIVTHSAVSKVRKGIRIKVATAVGDQLAKLQDYQLAALNAYGSEVFDAGVEWQITSLNPDNFRLNLTVVYDPLLLRADGSRVDGTSQTPVKDAIRNYLKNFYNDSFNGVFSLQKLTDIIQKVEGVKDLKINTAQSRYGFLPFADINISVTPDAGYMIMLDADFTANYIPNEQ